MPVTPRTHCEKCGDVLYVLPNRRYCKRCDPLPETFPRPPSNEQTLLSELGEAKRQLAVADKMILSSQAEVERSWRERDALAVTAEQYNEGIDNWIKRSYAQDEQILGLQAERDAARSEVKRLTEIITGWRAEYDHKEAVTREQIRRLRDSLAWFMSIDVFGAADEPEYDVARQLLKETAP